MVDKSNDRMTHIFIFESVPAGQFNTECWFRMYFQPFTQVSMSITDEVKKRKPSEKKKAIYFINSITSLSIATPL